MKAARSRTRSLTGGGVHSRDTSPLPPPSQPCRPYAPGRGAVRTPHRGRPVRASVAVRRRHASPEGGPRPGPIVLPPCSRRTAGKAAAEGHQLCPLLMPAVSPAPLSCTPVEGGLAASPAAHPNDTTEIPRLSLCVCQVRSPLPPRSSLGLWSPPPPLRPGPVARRPGHPVGRPPQEEARGAGAHQGRPGPRRLPAAHRIQGPPSRLQEWRNRRRRAAVPQNFFARQRFITRSNKPGRFCRSSP